MMNNEFLVEVTTMELFEEMVKGVMRLHYGEDYNVATYPVPKNNGTFKTGLVIMDNQVNITPTIYLDGFYTRFAQGEPMDALCEEIIELYEENRLVADFDMSMVRCFDRVQNVICLRLVNAKMNKELLKNVPHVLFHDLAIVFYILLARDSQELATIMIQNKFLDAWQVTIEELYQHAITNTKRWFDIAITPVLDMMLRTFAEDMTEEQKSELYGLLGADAGRVPLYVVTNQEKMFGANVLLNKEFLRQFADELDSDLYILPSSVHEVLVIPTSTDAELCILKAIVKEVNRTDVPEEQILSDSVYIYYRATDHVEMY